VSLVPDERPILILGLGNVLMCDDGAGVHALRDFAPPERSHAALRDGGTLGLTLLPEVEACSGLIVFDAAMMGAAPGEVRRFVGAQMDAQLSGRKTSVHELALADLLAAADLLGAKPERRALIGVQPQRVDWGLEPTAAVAAALPAMRAAACEIIGSWTS
jgi:hydrogenase maturation protease